MELSYSLCFSLTSASINLTLHQTSYEGVCFGDEIVLTCSVTGSGRLKWAVESIFTFSQDLISFNVFEHSAGYFLEPDPFPNIVNVTVLSAEWNQTFPVLGNISSQITVIVTEKTAGKHVYCSDGAAEVDAIVIKELCEWQ